MVDTDNIEDLARLYRLFIMIPDGLPCIKRALKQSITRRGGEINRSSVGPETGENVVDVDGMEEGGANVKGKRKHRSQNAPHALSSALKWVQDVLDLKDKLDQLWKQSFQSNRELESAINEVCLLPARLCTCSNSHSVGV